MTFESFSSHYFDKIAKWVIEQEPGVHLISKLSNDAEKFKFHVTWYNMCAPEGFNKVKFASDSQIEIIQPIEKWN